MTWSSFSLLVGVVYAVYYGGNILLDILRPSKTGAKEQTETLTFSENYQPTVIEDLDDDEELTPPVQHEAEKQIIDNNLEKEDKQAAVIQDDDMIVAKNVETILPSPLSGGVEFLELVKLCRQKAIVEASKHQFA